MNSRDIEKAIQPVEMKPMQAQKRSRTVEAILHDGCAPRTMQEILFMMGNTCGGDVSAQMREFERLEKAKKVLWKTH